jgi:protein translocase SecG subunit
MLIGLIMIQQKGGGLSSVFGGSSTNYMKKRGIEKYLNIFTIILIAIFIIVSILIFVV